MSNLPLGWEETPLETVVDILDAKRIPLNSSEREQRISGKASYLLFPYYGATGQVGVIDDYLFDGDHVLLGEDGVAFFDPLKHKAYRASGRFWVNNHAHVLKAIDGLSDFRFIEGYLNAFDYRGFVTGSTRLKLTQAAMRSMPIRIAPLKEQKRIADKLDAVLAQVDACRDRLDRIPAILKRFRQSVLAAATSGNLTQDWRVQNTQSTGLAKEEINQRLTLRREKQPSNKKFKEPVAPDLTYWSIEVPDTWSIESISAYAECLDHMRIPVTKENRSNTHGLFPYYGANGLVDMVDEYLFDDELVLVTEDETFFGREKPIAYRSSGRCWVNNHAHVLLASDCFRADYLCFVLMYYNVLPWLTGTTGRAKLTQGVLNSLPIAVPPQIELKEIVRRVESLFAYADRLEARYKTARAQVEKLTPALLAKAFRGELVPQDPNDEPASELLARIAATKPKHEPTKRSGHKAKASISVAVSKTNESKSGG